MTLAIRDMMKKKLQTIEETAFVQESARKMKDKNVSSLVVVDIDGKPQGLITERDLVRKVCVNEIPASAVKNKDIMSSSPLITIKASSSLPAAADMMLRYNVRHLLVIDDDNKDNGHKPLSIITPLDFTRYQEHIANEDREAIQKVLQKYMASEAEAGTEAGVTSSSLLFFEDRIESS